MKVKMKEGELVLTAEDINERLTLKAISQHAKIESVYKYVSVDLDRTRELMETTVESEPQRIRKVK